MKTCEGLSTYLLSARSVLLPTSIMMTSLPRSVLTSSIHFDVCWNELTSVEKGTKPSYIKHPAFAIKMTFTVLTPLVAVTVLNWVEVLHFIQFCKSDLIYCWLMPPVFYSSLPNHPWLLSEEITKPPNRSVLKYTALYGANCHFHNNFKITYLESTHVLLLWII